MVIPFPNSRAFKFPQFLAGFAIGRWFLFQNFYLDFVAVVRFDGRILNHNGVSFYIFTDIRLDEKCDGITCRKNRNSGNAGVQHARKAGG